MEFKDVVKFIIRHYRILILGLILGAALGLMYTLSSPAPYEAVSKILISRNKSDKESDFGYLTDQQLIQTYAYILKTRPILDLVNAQINGKVDPDNVRVSQVADTLILQIAVRDQNPQKAAYIANAFAKAMVTRSNQLQEEQYKLEEAGLTSQINSIRTQIDELQAQYDNREVTVNQSIIDDVDKQILAYRNEILTLQKEISLIKTPTNLEQESYIIERNTRLEEIQPLLLMYQEIRTNLEYLGRPYQSGSAPEDTTLSRLKTTIDQYQEVNLTLLNSLEKIRLEKVQSEPTVQTIEEADVPTDRTSLVFVMNPVIAGGVGLILAILVGLLQDRKGVKVANQQQLLKNLGLDVIGSIPPANVWKGNARMNPEITIEAEEMKPFHTLRAFIEFHRIRDSYKSLLVTSFAIGDGKSTVASAMAVNYVLGGDHIVLVDANFTNASQHIRFRTGKDVGLSDMLYRNLAFDRRFLKNTSFENLELLTAGGYSPIAMQLIDPQRMAEVLKNVENGQKLIIVDGPPLSDLNAMLLASAVDKIVIVIRTGVYALDGLAETLNELGVDRNKILGVVLNEPIPGEVEISSDEEDITARDLEETSHDLDFISEAKPPSQPSNEELTRLNFLSEDDQSRKVEGPEFIAPQSKGGDEPGVVDQSEFVPDSSQERVLSRLFHFPKFVVKKEEKKVIISSAEEPQENTGDQLDEKIEPFLSEDQSIKPTDKDPIDDSPTISQGSDETRSILGWLQFWRRPKEQETTTTDESPEGLLTSIADNKMNSAGSELSESIENSYSASTIVSLSREEIQEPVKDIEFTSSLPVDLRENTDLDDQNHTSIIEKVRHSLKSIWNQLRGVFWSKNGMTTDTEADEQMNRTVDSELEMPVAAEVALDYQKETEVVEEPQTRIKPKRTKKAVITAETQMEIPVFVNDIEGSKESSKGISESNLSEDIVNSKKRAGRGRPAKNQKQELEPVVLKTSSPQMKSSTRGKPGKDQAPDTTEKKPIKAIPSGPKERSRATKTRRVIATSNLGEIPSKSDKTDSSARIRKSKTATAPKKTGREKSKVIAGLEPTSSDQKD
ncbi:MAG: AAA family ATPase [Anaerolineaceae bacterium]|nr:AAA family ATPase [Anaerolineaceae bacterium]